MPPSVSTPAPTPGAPPSRDVPAPDAEYTVHTNGQLEPHLHQEWLLTNGLGGFASSSVVGCNTRRYHGVLVAATLPPVGRVMALNRIGEVLRVGGDERTLEFSVNEFAHALHPRGDRYLRRFELGDTARWVYDVEGVRVTKELQLLWMKNVAAVRYTVEPAAPAASRGKALELRLLPFVSLRDFHGTRRAAGVRFDVSAGDDHVEVSSHSHRHDTHVWADGARFVEDGDWWFGHRYAIDADRGQDDPEDLYTPGRFVAEVDGRTTVTLWVGLERGAYDWDAELDHRRRAVSAACSLPENLRPQQGAPAGLCAPERARSAAVRRLVRAANDFIVHRKTPDGRDGTSVIAGYPWFADWGRDTFISLPGLLLVTGRFAQAREVLAVFAEYVSEGMIPNRFDDYNNEPHYNTVDASLWFVHAAFEYLRLSGDRATHEKLLLPACRKVIDGYRNGTRFGIRMDSRDSLVTQGDEHTQLTWMDAKHGNVAFTPRQGKPVEINALWYNALRLMGEDALAERVRESFARAIWISPFRGLADVVTDGPVSLERLNYYKDTSIRPNQVFAASLPHSPLTDDQRHAVVEVVRRELLTPVGLRTLATGDHKYLPKYFGPQSQRDAAYHNGAIWPWLIGGFLDAYLHVNQNSAKAVEQARAWLRPLVDHMDDTGCVGQVAEIFEAEEPHRPVGCPAQAWSVAEVLRLAVKLGM
jgi:predicted glycogen debranching enzyme